MRDIKGHLFIDLDGVLADFDTEYYRLFREAPNRKTREPAHMWDHIAAHGSFFLDMQPMLDAFQLWRHVEPHKPTILTGCPNEMPEAADHKRYWVKKHFGPHIPVICCKSRQKSMHMEAGDVLVDDWGKYRKLWVDRGGVWVAHTSARQSIFELKEHGFT